jgi:hypothetical protein
MVAASGANLLAAGHTSGLGLTADPGLSLSALPA